MASFRVSKPHSMAKNEVREAAEELARELKNRHGLNYRWQGDSATFSRSGLDGKLSIEEDSIELSIKMGLLASAFERPLKKAITEFLDEYVS